MSAAVFDRGAFLPDPFTEWYHGRPFQVAFAVSLLVHAVLIVVVPGLRSVNIEPEQVISVEILMPEEQPVAERPQPAPAREPEVMPPPVPNMAPVPRERRIEQQIAPPEPQIQQMPEPTVAEPELPPVARAELAPPVPRPEPRPEPIVVERPQPLPEPTVAPSREPPPVLQRVEPRIEPRPIERVEPRPQIQPDFEPRPAPALQPPTELQPQVSEPAPPRPAPVAPSASQPRPAEPVIAPRQADPVAPPSVAAIEAPPPVAAPVPPAPSRPAIDETRLMQTYGSEISREIQRYQRYPVVAQRRGWEGTAEVLLRIAADGSVVSIEIGKSSGREILDAEAVNMVRRASPLPQAPDSLRGRELSVTIPIVFRLQES